MSMSTKISNLPGPLPENIPEENTNYNLNETNTNITADIKKRVRFADEEHVSSTSLMSQIRNEVNEENVLVLAFLFLASVPSLTGYVHYVPIIKDYASTDFLTAVFKAILLLLMYLVVKLYILPKIKI